MIKQLITAIKTNEYTTGQTILLTAVLAAIVFGGLYLINPSLIHQN